MPTPKVHWFEASLRFRPEPLPKIRRYRSWRGQRCIFQEPTQHDEPPPERDVAAGVITSFSSPESESAE